MRISPTSLLNLFLFSLLISGCASTKYSPAIPGVTDVGKMNVTLGTGWFRVPDAEAAERRSLSRVLSRDSVDSNRLMLIPGINEGQSIFVSKDSESSLPAFSADMSPLQVADLVALSMQQSLWNSQSTVTASNARDSGFTGISGFRFDLSVALPDGKIQKGMAGGFIDDDRLYVNIFVAEFPAPFDEQESIAQQVIDSAVLRLKTIRAY